MKGEDLRVGELVQRHRFVFTPGKVKIERRHFAVIFHRGGGFMRQAISATAAGYEAAMRMIRPGVGEAQISHALEETYRLNGAEEVAYNSIVGSGMRDRLIGALETCCRQGEMLRIQNRHIGTLTRSPSPAGTPRMRRTAASLSIRKGAWRRCSSDVRHLAQTRSCSVHPQESS